MVEQNDLQFDLALSYCSEDSWAARDLYNLISQQGFSVYCFDHDSDCAGGLLRSKLTNIYKNSRLNIILWSKYYFEECPDTIVSMEKRTIVNRHLLKGDDDTLIIVTLDEKPLDQDLEDILAHKLQKEGITGLTKLIIERLKKIYMTVNKTGLVFHPKGTNESRDSLRPCSFIINQNFKSDPHRRWERLADVLVDFHNPLGTKNVYLIPSGLANPLLRHTALLKDDPRLLEYKRKATEKFIEMNKDRKIDGFWFIMRLGDAEVATVYSHDYDRFLNASLQENISQ